MCVFTISILYILCIVRIAAAFSQNPRARVTSAAAAARIFFCHLNVIILYTIIVITTIYNIYYYIVYLFSFRSVPIFDCFHRGRTMLIYNIYTMNGSEGDEDGLSSEVANNGGLTHARTRGQTTKKK